MGTAFTTTVLTQFHSRARLLIYATESLKSSMWGRWRSIYESPHRYLQNQLNYSVDVQYFQIIDRLVGSKANSELILKRSICQLMVCVLEQNVVQLTLTKLKKALDNKFIFSLFVEFSLFSV